MLAAKSDHTLIGQREGLCSMEGRRHCHSLSARINKEEKRGFEENSSTIIEAELSGHVQVRIAAASTDQHTLRQTRVRPRSTTRKRRSSRSHKLWIDLPTNRWMRFHRPGRFHRWYRLLQRLANQPPMDAEIASHTLNGADPELVLPTNLSEQPHVGISPAHPFPSGEIASVRVTALVIAGGPLPTIEVGR